jgi:hypothetical protein
MPCASGLPPARRRAAFRSPARAALHARSSRAPRLCWQTLAEGRSKWVASFVFHPTQPFALSVLQSFMHPQQINAHFRWQ